MRRHNSLVFLSQDHHQGLMLAQLIKKGAPAFKKFPNSAEGKKKYTLEFYHNELSRHFDEEENLLYPFVKGKNSSIDKLFDEIINEHKIIREIISSLADNINIEEKLDRLGKLLASHIRKEERQLFPSIQEQFNEEDLLTLELKIKKDRIKKF
jgi:iron-sulfur cluster repair protein YtfE (RIC family)